MIKRFLRFLFSIFFIGAFLYFYVDNPEAVGALRAFGWFVLLAAIFQLVSFYFNDLFTKLLVDHLNEEKKVTLVDGYYSAFISSFGNYFLPLTGGAFLRARFLRKNYHFSYKKFISITYGTYVISFFTNSTLALICLTAIYLQDHSAVNYSLTAVIALLFTATSFFMIKRGSLIEKLLSVLIPARLQGRFYQLFIDVIKGWNEILEVPGLISKLFSLTFLNTLVRTFFYYIAFTSLGVTTSIFQMLLFNVLISLAMYISLTPGAVGIREALLLFYGNYLNLSTQDILTVSLLDRATLILVLVALYLMFEFGYKKKISDLFSK